jgi:hypothetical protein
MGWTIWVFEDCDVTFIVTVALLLPVTSRDDLYRKLVLPV